MSLIDPHGGKLSILFANEEERIAIQDEALSLVSLTLNDRQLCDFEMLINGAFSPLEGFLGKSDYENVINNNRLADGNVWPIPITLDVSSKLIEGVDVGDKISLRDHEGILLAVLKISDIWNPDLTKETLIDK